MKSFAARRMTKWIFETSRARLLLLFLFSLAIRTALITEKNIWYDEAFSWHLSNLSFYQIFITTAGDIHPPFNYFVLKIWNTVFGDSLLSMRMLSAVFSTASLYFVYKIAREYLSEADSYLISILYIISPLNIFFAQEVRMASLSLCLTTASTFFYIRLVSAQPDPAGFKRGAGISLSKGTIRNYAIAYIVFAALALYTHYFTALVLAAHFIYFLFIRTKMERSNSRRTLIAFIVVLFLFVPWIPIMVKQVWMGQPWREGQSLLAAGTQIFEFVNDITLGFYYRFEKNIVTFTLHGLTVILAIAFFFLVVKRHAFSLPGLLVLIPLVSSVLIAFFRWIEFFRYLSIILPYILICGFMVFKNVKPDRFSRPTRFAVFILFFALNIYGDWLYFKKDFKNNDYRPVVSDIRADSKTGDRIFIYPFYYRWVLEFYQKHGGLPEIFDYGYEYARLRDELKTYKSQVSPFSRRDSFEEGGKGDVYFILDYSFPDTADYSEKVTEIQKDYEVIYSKQYETVPHRIELYKLKPRN